VVATVAAVMVGAGLLTYKGVSSRPPQTPGPPPVVPRNDRTERSRRSAEPKPVIASPKKEEIVQEENPPQRAAEETSTLSQADVTETLPAELPSVTVSGGSDASDFQLDLSSPEAAVRSFIKAMVAGDAESAMACFLPEGEDYEDMEEAVYADPDDPAQRSEYAVKLLFQALDSDAEMPMSSVEETEHGTSVVWQVTFKSEFTVEGHTFNAGDTMDFDGTLRRSGDSWLIDAL